jgi:hypothetical protein
MMMSTHRCATATARRSTCSRSSWKASLRSWSDTLKRCGVRWCVWCVSCAPGKAACAHMGCVCTHVHTQAHKVYLEGTEHRMAAFKKLTGTDASTARVIEQRMKKLVKLQVWASSSAPVAGCCCDARKMPGRAVPDATSAGRCCYCCLVPAPCRRTCSTGAPRLPPTAGSGRCVLPCAVLCWQSRPEVYCSLPAGAS